MHAPILTCYRFLPHVPCRDTHNKGLPALGLLCMHVSERSAISWEILFFQIHMPQTIDCLVKVDVKHMQQGLKMCGGERLQRGSTSEHARGHHAAP